MSSYKVFKHPEKGFEAVKSGFAWLAPFNPVWPLFRGLWMLFMTYIFFILVLASIDVQIYGLEDFIDITNANNLQWIFLIVQIVIFASPGFKGNEWTAKNLQKNGYIFDCSIEAKNKNEALILATKPSV
ncbi:MAG: hypothetical protein HN496_01565 [Flavobacteriaceae bacterium]|jgi:hypothetical protein|nr:hypothetical protein [Flavobacteriaceae bacterium]MBT4586833.1 hypothetical protein [Gammaproteobacteria bacterium]MBT6634453.1 hypothetical protein [Gammaproteobacteria bacterium]MBT8009427.1 hypothetical protein [Gammaproteobacteria bacterium]